MTPGPASHRFLLRLKSRRRLNDLLGTPWIQDLTAIAASGGERATQQRTFRRPRIKEDWIWTDVSDK